MATIDLFEELGPKCLQGMAATTIQRRAKGVLTRNSLRDQLAAKNLARKKSIEMAIVRERLEKVSVTRIQAIVRGWVVFRRNLTAEKKKEWLRNRLTNISRIQGLVRRYNVQSMMTKDVLTLRQKVACLRIQRIFRGYMARCHYERIQVEPLWPLKCWLQYTATSPETTHIDVRFVQNPRFDTQKFMDTYGGKTVLVDTLQEMKDTVQTSVDTFLFTQGLGPKYEQEKLRQEEENRLKRRKRHASKGRKS